MRWGWRRGVRGGPTHRRIAMNGARSFLWDESGAKLWLSWYRIAVIQRMFIL